MKRFFVTMLISMMTFVGLMAQLHIWYNGTIVYQRDYTLIDSITFTIQDATHSSGFYENIPTKVENLIGTPDNDIRSSLQSEGYRIIDEYSSNEELFLIFENNNQDTIKCAFRQSNLLTEVNAIMHIPSANYPLDIYKEWSSTTYNLASWQNWRGYIRELPQSDVQYFSGRTLYVSVLNSLSSANYVAEENVIDRDNYSSLSFQNGALVSRIEYVRGYRKLAVMPVSIELPDTLRVGLGNSINIPYEVQPHGALLSYITATIDDSSIAEIDGTLITGKALGFTIMHVTCGKIQKTVVVQCVPELSEGMYVIGSATAIPSLYDADAQKGLMAVGVNEVTKMKRPGMYEKYIALEGGKDFEIVLVENGTAIQHYGASLVLSDTLDDDNAPEIQVYQGVLNNNIKMRVANNGLYHIIVDLNVYGDLQDKQIMVIPVEWGVRGAMNSWGYSAMNTPEFNKTSMTYVIEDQLVKGEGLFKFAHGNGWRFPWDQAGMVKVENSLGSNADADGGEYTSLLQGGKNLPISCGYWKLELKWTLEGGALEKSFTYTPTLTKEYSIDPTNLVISLIGSAIENDYNWGTDANLSYKGINDGYYTYSIDNLTLYANEFKVRLNHDWSSSYGFYDLVIVGDEGNFSDNSSTIKVAEEKVYKKISFQFTLENKVRMKNIRLLFEL